MIRNFFNPWEEEPSGASGKGSLEEMLKDLLRRLEKLWKGQEPKSPRDGQKPPLPKGLILSAFALGGLLWLSTGLYQVEPDERGVVLRFGQWVRTTSPGLHYHLPAPIESVITQRMTTVHRIDIGAKAPSSPDEMPEEDLVLTGDSNIANISFSVLWRVRDDGVERFLFNSQAAEHIIRSAAESIMREIVGQMPITYTQTEGRAAISDKVRELLQCVLDEYNIGVEIVQVLLQNVEPPAAVIDAFRDVERAQADQQSEINKAEAYDRDIRARTRGKVASIQNAAEAQKAILIAKAEGETAAFLLVLEQYKMAPEITAERLFIDYLGDIYEKTRKVLIDSTAKTSGLVPYFPLSDLEKKREISPDRRES